MSIYPSAELYKEATPTQYMNHIVGAASSYD